MRTSITYEWPRYSRLKPRTTWINSRITNIDMLALDEAAKLTTKHAVKQITISDFLRAAACGEIRLRAIIRRAAKVQRFDGEMYWDAGMPTENFIPSVICRKTGWPQPANNNLRLKEWLLFSRRLPQDTCPLFQQMNYREQRSGMSQPMQFAE